MYDCLVILHPYLFSSRTLCHKRTHFSVFCTNWKISHTHIYYYSTTYCHTAYSYTVNSVKHYLLYIQCMSLFLFLTFHCIVYSFTVTIGYYNTSGHTAYIYTVDRVGCCN